MGKDKKDKSIKEFSLTDMEISEFSFYDQCIQMKQIELRALVMAKSGHQSNVLKRLGINEEEYEIDPSKIYSTGKIFAKKIPKPVIKPQDETAEPKPVG